MISSSAVVETKTGNCIYPVDSMQRILGYKVIIKKYLLESVEYYKVKGINASSI